ESASANRSHSSNSCPSCCGRPSMSWRHIIWWERELRMGSKGPGPTRVGTDNHTPADRGTAGVCGAHPRRFLRIPQRAWVCSRPYDDQSMDRGDVEGGGRQPTMVVSVPCLGCLNRGDSHDCRVSAALAVDKKTNVD